MTSLEIASNNYPLAMKIIKNAKIQNKISHLYLISTFTNENISMIATVLMQSIVCEEKNIVACLKCQLCKRIAKYQYIDLEIIDTDFQIIKKKIILKSIWNLQKTSNKKNNKKIFLIKNIELANKESANSLLKFIEDPQNNIYIVMTSNNFNKILPTIKSRAQNIYLKTNKKKTIYDDLLKQNIDHNYAYLLQKIFSNTEESLKCYKKNFLLVLEKVKLFLKEFIQNYSKAEIIFDDFFIKKNNYQLFLKILNVFFNDIWRYNLNQNIYCLSFKDLIKKFLKKNFMFEKAIELIIDFQNSLKANGNFELSKWKFILELKGL